MNSLTKFYNRRKVLVTGGAGFIGSNLSLELVRLGARVTIVDNFSSGNVENLRKIIHKIELVVGDIRSPHICQSTVAGKSVIFHTAALVSVPKSIEQPSLCHAINVVGTEILLRALAQERPTPHMVFSSSSAVYGDCPGTCSEETPLHPKSPYALSKVQGERLCHKYAQHKHLTCTILRYFNVYGPQQSPHNVHSAVVARFTEALKRGRKITVFGDGSQLRDYIHVSKVVEANLIAGTLDQKACDVFNIASGKSIDIISLIRKLEEETGHKSVGIEFKPGRAGDIQRSQANCKKFSKLLKAATEKPRQT